MVFCKKILPTFAEILKPDIMDKTDCMEKTPKLDKLLEIIWLLADTGGTFAHIAAKAHVSERTAYRYVETLENSGFIINKEKGVLFLEGVPEPFARIADNVGVTPKEWRLVVNALDSVEDALKPGLLQKINERIDKPKGVRPVIRQQESMHIQELSRAMDGKKQVILHQYSSSNSETVSDRRVEPIAFRSGNRSVVCYEIRSQRVKTFKIPRIGKVEVCPEDWQHERAHRTPVADMFGMSSDTLIPIRLRLTMRAANLLKEEFPESKRMLRPDGEEHFLFETEVRDVKGIGRFVLGLHNEVEIIEAPELESYLKIHAKQLAMQYLTPPTDSSEACQDSF